MHHDDEYNYQSKWKSYVKVSLHILLELVALQIVKQQVARFLVQQIQGNFSK